MFCDQFVLCQEVQKKEIWLISAAVVLAFRHSCRDRTKKQSDNEFSSPFIPSNQTNTKQNEGKGKKKVSSFLLFFVLLF